LKRIKQLEREILQMRGKHSDTIQQLKAKFLQEKSEYTEESNEKIEELSREANKVSADQIFDFVETMGLAGNFSSIFRL